MPIDMFPTWKFDFAQNIQPDDQLAGAINCVFMDGFGLQKGWDFDKIKRSLAQTTLVGLLVDLQGNIGGYAMYSAPDEPLEGYHLLWEDAICIKKNLQGKGFSSQAWNIIQDMLVGKKLGWIGGRTQNPVVIHRYAKFGLLFPFQASYAHGAGKQMMAYLRQHIAEVKSVSSMDENNGICRRVYRSGQSRLGDYSLQVKGTEVFEKQLSGWGFERDCGDAVIVVSRLPRPIESD